MDDCKFEIRCDASPNGQLHVKSHAVSAAISQVIRRNTTDEIWQAVLVISEESQDGSLTTKIIICHPDWDQNLQIACIRSRIAGKDGPPVALEVDLKTVHV
jgi:hypothetical protein